MGVVDQRRGKNEVKRERMPLRSDLCTGRGLNNEWQAQNRKLLKEEFGVVSSLLVEVVATTGGPYGEKLGEELDENSELFAVGNLKIKDSTLQRFLRECDQVAPWFAVSGSLTVSSWEKLGRDLDFAAEQGTLRPGVKPVWRLVRGCLEDQHCSSALECGQAALEQLQEELSEKAESEKTAPQKAPKDRGRKGNTERLYPSLSDIEDSDGESTDSAISEMDSLIQGMHRARIRDKPKAPSKSEGACRYTPPTAPPLYPEMPRGTSNHPDLWREVQRELSVVCPVFVDDRNQRYHEPLDFKNIKSIAESVRTYGVTAAFTITQVESLHRYCMTPTDWLNLARACLSPGQYLDWRAYFTDYANEQATRNAAEGEIFWLMDSLVSGPLRYAWYTRVECVVREAYALHNIQEATTGQKSYELPSILGFLLEKAPTSSLAPTSSDFTATDIYVWDNQQKVKFALVESFLSYVTTS
ncbi:hypothetical protein STEG23_006420 [Scotinomys teguina]